MEIAAPASPQARLQSRARCDHNTAPLLSLTEPVISLSAEHANEHGPRAAAQHNAQFVILVGNGQFFFVAKAPPSVRH